MKGKIPARSRIPGRFDIYTRMSNRFGAHDRIVGNLIDMCADEAEKIVMECMRYETTPTVTMRKIKGRKEVECKRCGKTVIRYDFRYCPNCGTVLNWID